MSAPRSQSSSQLGGTTGSGLPAGRVHFVGVGGIHMSALAGLVLDAGGTVSGSDLTLSPLTDALAARGATIRAGHDAGNVCGAALVVRTVAVRRTTTPRSWRRRGPGSRRSRARRWSRGWSRGATGAGGGRQSRQDDGLDDADADPAGGRPRPGLHPGRGVARPAVARRLGRRADGAGGRRVRPRVPSLRAVGGGDHQHRRRPPRLLRRRGRARAGLRDVRADAASGRAAGRGGGIGLRDGRRRAGARAPARHPHRDVRAGRRRRVGARPADAGGAQPAQRAGGAGGGVGGGGGGGGRAAGARGVPRRAAALRAAGRGGRRHGDRRLRAPPARDRGDDRGAGRSLRGAAHARAVPAAHLQPLGLPAGGLPDGVPQGSTHCCITDTYAAREAPEAGIDAAALAAEIREPAAEYAGDLDAAAAVVAARLRDGDVFVAMGAGSVERTGPDVLERLRAR